VDRYPNPNPIKSSPCTGCSFRDWCCEFYYICFYLALVKPKKPTRHAICIGLTHSLSFDSFMAKRSIKLSSTLAYWTINRTRDGDINGDVTLWICHRRHCSVMIWEYSCNISWVIQLREINSTYFTSLVHLPTHQEHIMFTATPTWT